MADKMMRIAGRDANGLAKAVKTDNNGNLGVSLKGIFASLHAGAVATGGGNILDVSGMASGTLRVTGTFAATMILQGRMEATHTWSDLSVLNASTNKTAATVTASGLYQFDCQGMNEIRLAIAQYTSGSITAEASVKPFGFSSLTTTIANEKLPIEVTGSKTARAHTNTTTPGEGYDRRNFYCVYEDARKNWHFGFHRHSSH